MKGGWGMTVKPVIRPAGVYQNRKSASWIPAGLPLHGFPPQPVPECLPRGGPGSCPNKKPRRRISPPTGAFGSDHGPSVSLISPVPVTFVQPTYNMRPLPHPVKEIFRFNFVFSGFRAIKKNPPGCTKTVDPPRGFPWIRPCMDSCLRRNDKPALRRGSLTSKENNAMFQPIHNYF